MQVILCPLTYIGIAANHCLLAKLWRSYPTEFAIERQLKSDVGLNSDNASAW